VGKRTASVSSGTRALVLSPLRCISSPRRSSRCPCASRS
jgi:hypothetical protein